MWLTVLVAAITLIVLCGVWPEKKVDNREEAMRQ